ncbi:hypothetical protein DSAG12_00490 [Promethearchaeum syntrophicum]|uniref:Uncharacterized protein n=1 Tax=Promethearchaeum syntrophicum TaxID=2594042 RepID=A0A5B9D784_9ARCH|nr:hypothetical protein [Candidatus Prometheoarchaeum syntrophicum]QEE14677.1 hypothetical protein DSAG12_00490 [Candidatus Prometheoarchaeum syntrophicum]
MKSINLKRFGFWVGLISALVIILVLIPKIERYTLFFLIILAIFGLEKLGERICVRIKLTAEQVTNAHINNRSNH